VLRLMIVDDHPVVREGLRGMLEADPGITVVGEAA
jgi:DNA-binding NarL/FixJ family response regulator